LLDISLVIALIALASALFIDIIQTRGIKSVDNFLKGSRDVGEQFGDWLLRKEKLEDGTETTNLALCGKVLGHEIAQHFSMSLKGMASGDARVYRNVEQKVIEGLQSPEAKALIGFADSIGVDRQYIGPLYEILEKRGLLNGIVKNDGHPQGSSTSW